MSLNIFIQGEHNFHKIIWISQNRIFQVKKCEKFPPKKSLIQHDNLFLMIKNNSNGIIVVMHVEHIS
jgi:hypothetical protein